MKNKQKKGFTFRGKYLLLAVLIGYCVLFLANSQMAFQAAQKSTKLLGKIIPIITVVIFLTAFLNYKLSPKTMAKHLGKDSGLRGWLWALGSGVASHGPMYVWYPLLEELREHGTKDELIVTFFASRAIKVPLLPLMVDYFGLLFTVLLSFYMLIAAVLQGLCMHFLQKKSAGKTT
jgi:uncharacterized membrane protein YraQ (UPF0718 family)